MYATKESIWYLLIYQLSLTLFTDDTHYSDVIMSAMASQIIGVLIVYSTICSGANQRKHQSSAITDLCEGNSPVTGEFPVTRKMFPFDAVIVDMAVIFN